MANIYKHAKYEDYINSQMRNEGLTEGTKTTWKGARLEDIAVVKKVFPEAKSALCIGCRHEAEVQDFIDAGFDSKGIDLFTSSALVEKLDMHEMGDHFAPHQFDVCYMSHSLEHCMNPTKVFQALAKISRMGVSVVLPSTTTPDPHDTCVFDFMKTEVTDFGQVAQEIAQFTDRKFVIDGYGRRPARGLEIIFSIKWL